ncbi:ABC transporter family substrate-binding protein [Tomitella fengzijianii]|uniref:ABC transporter family substrate-binding protein n=2 Tax=Tomitella fengzijianii TaxID=2597660 RepID=A0A516X7Y9_9ACTN|nr:ABC transporter family substrate-binding protein [Tomitella fengzijianii]
MFRLAPDPEDPARLTLQPDSSVLDAAVVVNQDPFTVEYRLSTEAQWSDSAPIAVEDFQYLWQQMVTAPGAVAPSGYRQITDIRAVGGGGKTVQVVFARPYDSWRDLFRALVPAHLLKDMPGGFETGLDDGVPVSGSRFKVSTVDRGRGQILLERNDRFWGPPATPDRVVIRRAGSTAQLSEALRGGDVQVFDVRAGEAALSQLSAVGGVQARRADRARSLSLTLNARAPHLRDVQLRRALLDLLDPQRLALIGADSEAGARWVGSATAVPSDPAYRVTAPPRMPREAAQDILRAAGYGLAAPDGETSDDPVLQIKIGVPRGDTKASEVASTVADVWTAAGVDASVAEIDPETLYGDALTTGAVDAVVGWEDVDVDLAARVAARYGCDGSAVSVHAPVPPAEAPAAPKTVEPTAPPAASASAAPTASPAAPTGTATPAPRPVPPLAPGDPARKNFAQPQAAPSNIGGVCDEELQPVIARALQGEIDDDRLVEEVDPAAWSLATVLPIMQDTGVVGSTSAIEGTMLGDGLLASALFVNAAGWHRTPGRAEPEHPTTTTPPK